MRVHEALRTTKWSFFCEFFHEHSLIKRGGLRTWVCFLAVLVSAGAAFAEPELPVKVESQWFVKATSVSPGAVTNVIEIPGGINQTNSGYAYNTTLSLAPNVKALVVGAYLDANGAAQSNATFGGKVADGYIPNDGNNNRLATYYWYNPSTNPDQELVVYNKTKDIAEKFGFAALGLSGVDTTIRPGLSAKVGNQVNTTVIVPNNNMFTVSFGSYNGANNLQPPTGWEWIDSFITFGDGTAVAATKWYARGPVTERITWTGFPSGANNRSVHAVSFPSTMSGVNPYYLPQVRIENLTPDDASTVMKNPVKFSANVITFGTVFSNAEFNLNGEVIPTTWEETGFDPIGGTTNKVTSVNEYTLGAYSNAYFALELWTSQYTNKYFYTFKMGPEFTYAASPANNAVVADLTPEVKTTVYDAINEANVINLWIDGVPVAATTDYESGTSTATFVMSELERGQKVDFELIVEDTENDVYTNKSSFTVAGKLNSATTWEEDNKPDVTDYDQYHFGTASGMTNNIGNNEISNTLRHEWTFISKSDRPAQGQTFTVPPAVYGINVFDLDSVWIKQSAYYETRDDDALNTMWFAFSKDKNLKLRITDPAKAGTDGFVVASYTLNIGNTMTNFSGNWIQLRLPETLLLQANKQYGFDVTANEASDPRFNMDGLAGGTYAGGTAYSSGDNGAGDNTMKFPADQGAGDRSFIVQLRPTTNLFSVGAVTPSGGGVLNPVIVTVPLTDVTGYFYGNGSKIEIDGVGKLDVWDEDGEEDGSYTFFGELPDNQQLKPMNTYTGLYVLTNHPGAGWGTMSNTFTFTMGEAYSFAGQSPSTTVLTNQVYVSVKVINKVDTFGSAELFVDNTKLNDVNITSSGKTNTVSGICNGLGIGVHTAKVIVTSANDGFGAYTNSWNFKVTFPVTDRSWNINIAGPSNGTARNVAQGTIAIAPPSGANSWNNLVGTTGTTEVKTNNFINTVLDTNGGNPISILSYGNYNWGNNYTGDGEIRVDLFKGYAGASNGGQTPNHDAYWSITGLNATAAYDLYIYSTWTWNENASRFDITEGMPLDGIRSKTITAPERDNVSVSANKAKAGDDFTACVEGQNYVIFARVTPTKEGKISLRSGFDVDCVLSAMQIQEHAGEGIIQFATLTSWTPEGVVYTNPVLKAVIQDGAGTVTSNKVVLRLDGQVLPNTGYDKVGINSTVTNKITASLDIGTHEVSLIVVSDLPQYQSVTSSWEFYKGGSRVDPPVLQHHWNFEEGEGTIVYDRIGSKHAHIVGFKHQWVKTGTDGGVKLEGGKTNSEWNDGRGDEAGAGAYVDIPNGIISELDSDAVSIEIRFATEELTAWTRIYDFGTSYDGAEISSAWVSPNTNNTFVLVANSDVGCGQNSVRLNNASGVTEFEALKKLNDGRKHHMVTVLDTVGRVLHIYRDGVRVNEEPEQYSLPATFDDLSEFVDNNNWLGRSQWEHDPLWQGTIYDLRIYSGVVSEEQAERFYQGNYEEPQPPPEGPAISVTVPAGGALAISWLVTAGNNFSVMTNADLTNPDGWGVVNGTVPQLNGYRFTVEIEFGEESSLFYKLRSNQ